MPYRSRKPGDKPVRAGKYTPELAARILQRVACGQSLRHICQDPSIGIVDTGIRHWIRADFDGFAQRYKNALLTGGRARHAAVPEGHRMCSKCREIKPLNDFHKRSTPGRHTHYRSYCKTCTTDSCREWEKSDYKKTREIHRFSKLKTKYGVTRESYNHMMTLQRNRCPLCKEEFTDKWGPKYPCVDHCHIRGHVRALLCRNCNSVLGMVKDDPEILKRFILFIEADNL